MRVAGLTTALCLLPLALSSSGDRHPLFHQCHSTCLASPAAPLSPVLSALLWDRSADCAYHCSHELTDLADAGQQYYHQFHGKWAFYRLIAQEPASVLFSLGNLWVHVRGYQAAIKLRPSPMKRWLIAAAVIQVNTWIWSAVFHVRDLPLTEKLDYFSALSTVAFTLLYAIIRVMRLNPVQSDVVALILAVLVLAHIVYVSSLPLFPYGYHVGVAIVLGLIGNLLWITWTASWYLPVGIQPTRHTNGRKPPHANTPAILVALTIAAMSLEVLDFAPLGRIIDAHSLWHAATIPLGEAWWRFLETDAEYESDHVLTKDSKTRD